jgi:predicted CXXCH cytochrome family protein
MTFCHPRVLLAGLASLLAGTAGCALPSGQAKPVPGPPPWVSYPEATVATVENPHQYLGAPLCQRCHADPGGALRAEPMALCQQGHVQRHGNHPVGVVQKQPSKDRPYGPGGRILCHTCHDQHDLLARKKGLRLPFNELCLKCHQQH